MHQARFLNELVAREVDEFGGIDRLEERLLYDSALLNCRIEVPKGYLTDYCSFPRWMPLAYALMGGKARRAGALHDFLYSGGKVARYLVPAPLDRKTCDLILREAVIALGYSKLMADVMYAGVRLGGESHFKAPNLPQSPAVAAAMHGDRPVADLDAS